MELPHGSISMDDPVVLATMNLIKSIAIENHSAPDFNYIRNLVSSIVVHPQLFDSVSQQIRDVFPCDSALDLLKNVLNTENKAAPLPPDELDYEDDHRRKTRSWIASEDYRLLMGVHLYGEEDWNEVAEFVGGGRTRSQCSQRWCRVIDPKISKDRWKAEEEQRLMTLVEKYGVKSWIKIAQEMKGRSDVQCRYKYNKLMNFHRNDGKEKKNDVIKAWQNQKPLFVDIPETDTFNMNSYDSNTFNIPEKPIEQQQKNQEEEKNKPILYSEQFSDPFNVNQDKTLYGVDCLFSINPLDM